MPKKPVLTITEENFGWQIAWYFFDTEDLGAVLGDDEYMEAQLATVDPIDRDHALATITARATKGVQRRTHHGYFWDTRSEATAALAIIKVTLKTDKGAPWPEWAIKAKAAGWKPPKNWKPS